MDGAVAVIIVEVGNSVITAVGVDNSTTGERTVINRELKIIHLVKWITLAAIIDKNRATRTLAPIPSCRIYTLLTRNIARLGILNTFIDV